MVIKYSREQLLTLGKLVMLNEAVAVCNPAAKFNINTLPIEQQNCLTQSVAEFFIKGQINFHPKTDIDPTKVRRLSEVEAELINGPHQDATRYN